MSIKLLLSLIIWGFFASYAMAASLDTDPDLVAFYKFDEGTGVTCADSSPVSPALNGTITTMGSSSEPRWVTGKIGGAVNLRDPNSMVSCGYNAKLNATNKCTVTCWINPVWQLNIYPGLQYAVSRGGAQFGLRQYSNFKAFYTADDELGEDMVGHANDICDEQWHFVAGTWDATAGSQKKKVFVDGRVVVTNEYSTILAASANPLYIGAQNNTIQHGSYGDYAYEDPAYFDEVRIYRRCLSPAEIVRLYNINQNLAWDPQPVNSTTYEQTSNTGNITLTWQAGNGATTHNLYFGTTPGSMTLVQSNSSTSYSTTVVLGATYYWRVDEVETSTTGLQWSFIVSNYLLLDGFETYATDTALRAVWAEPFGGNHIDTAKFNSGVKSMRLAYQNEYSPYHTEVTRTFTSFDMSTANNGIRALGLFTHGTVDNVAQPLYVILTDTSSRTAKLVNPNSNVTIQEAGETFESSDIAMTAFTDVNPALDLAHIRKITLGVGSDLASGQPVGDWDTIYIDDIRLYQNRCLPSEGPTADFSDDCVVNGKDLKMLSEQWLVSDYNITTSNPGTNHLKGHWRLDNNLLDESPLHNNGTFAGSPTYVPAKYNQGVYISAAGQGITIPNAANYEGFTNVTMSCWIKLDKLDSPNGTVYRRLISKHKAWFMFVYQHLEGVVTADIRQGRTDNLQVKTLKYIDDQQWHHIAATYDCNTFRIYVDGVLDNSKEDTANTGIIDQANGTVLALGNNGTLNGDLRGKIDDCYVYDIALNDSQIAYIAADGAPLFYVPLSPSGQNINIGGGDQKIDFSDYAVMANQWLDCANWPIP